MLKPASQNQLPNTHGERIDFGKHKGELYTRVPVSYLRWMVNSMKDEQRKKLAHSEIVRRGSKLPEVEISGHAIDRASQRCLRRWEETRLNEDEGLHAWLCRITAEAIESGVKADDSGRRYKYLGMVVVVEPGDEWPVLATIVSRS